MLWENIDAADKMDESAEDMTAAEMAPIPKIDTHCGVKYCRTTGTTILVSARTAFVVLSPPFIKSAGRPSTVDQSEKIFRL